MASAFLDHNEKNRILFIGTGNTFETTVLGKNGYPHEKITSAGIKGMSLVKKLKAMAQIPRGIMESFTILRRFQPDMVIGVGGYSSGPVVLTAWIMKKLGWDITIALQEQNSLPGITNRILGRFSDRVYISFKETERFFPPSKTRLTGNPVRKEFLQAANQAAGHGASSDNDRFTVLVAGGSQGAHRINMTLVDALGTLKDKDRFFFIHQTGATDKEAVEAAYKTYGIPCVVRAFFDDMAAQYMKSDLIIARAGATTVAEITALGKPALFIPFPYAADNHQEVNANALVTQSAADMIVEKDLTCDLIGEKLDFYRSHRSVLDRMGKKAGALGGDDASRAIIYDCYQLMEKTA